VRPDAFEEKCLVAHETLVLRTVAQKKDLRPDACEEKCLVAHETLVLRTVAQKKDFAPMRVKYVLLWRTRDRSLRYAPPEKMSRPDACEK